MSYDFHQLNDKEFEKLSLDLLSKYFNTRIERFKPGKDQGIDGRFFINEEKNIIQAKHYLKTGYDGLIKDLKNIELLKVKKINPSRYIFSTSLGLSPHNKEEIKKIFEPYIISTSDVFGNDDLNSLLTSYPEIEEENFKLWISSTTIFNRFINNAITGRSKFELQEIINKSYKYVQTIDFNNALEFLKKNNVVIITGEPGIGKTTLAENLCLHYISKGYQLASIEESISEAENIYLPSCKQIFYFDDFLGSNYFEAIENKKDSHIMKFIERIKSDPTKRFILTSRTNILNNGLVYSNILYNKNIKNNELLLNITNLSLFDKAKILYNQIYHSNLNEEYINEIYKDKRYNNIIKHKNFNPRLVEFITDQNRIDVVYNNYRNYIENKLNNPEDIRRHPFMIQSDEYVRNLTLLVVFNGGSISETHLKQSLEKLNKIEKLVNTSNVSKDFKTIIEIATEFFLNRNIGVQGITYTLFNPSITDFVLNEYKENLEKITNIFLSLETISSANNLFSLLKANIMDKDIINKVITIVYIDAVRNKKDYNYILHILSKNFDKHHLNKEDIINFINKVIIFPPLIENITYFIELLFLYKETVYIENFSFIYMLFYDRDLDENELSELIRLYNNFNINNTYILDVIKEQLENFLDQLIQDISNDIDVGNFIEREYGEDGERIIIYTYTIDSINKELIKQFNIAIEKQFGNELNKIDIDINYKTIIESIDIENLIDGYLEGNKQNYDKDDYKKENNSYNYTNDIEDLFERN